MPFQSELIKIFRALRNWLLVLIIGTVFFFTCTIAQVEVRGVDIFVPKFSEFSLSAFVLTQMVGDIVPKGIPLVVTEPLSAFVAQVKMSFLLAFMVTLPFGLFSVVRYLQPALYVRERVLLYSVLVPASLLFIAGNAFAYVYILPTTFSVLYAYATPLGAMTFLSVDDFVGLSFALMLVCGVLFTLPVVMYLFSLLRVVPSSVWIKQWRYAAVIFLILSAIITPDGSGVTMVLLTTPLLVLYGVGAVLSTHLTHKV